MDTTLLVIIILCVGFGTAYIILYLVPLFRLLLSFDKEDWKKITFDHVLIGLAFGWFVLLTPFGAILLLPFHGEWNKWETRIMCFAMLLIIAALVIFIATL